MQKNCKKIGVVTGSLAVDLSFFQKMLEGEKVKDHVSSLHKLRQYKKNLKKPQ